MTRSGTDCWSAGQRPFQSFLSESECQLVEGHLLRREKSCAETGLQRTLWGKDSSENSLLNCLLAPPFGELIRGSSTKEKVDRTGNSTFGILNLGSVTPDFYF